MRLKQIEGEYSIGRYYPDTAFAALHSRNFCSITRTPYEVTIVCESDLLPPNFSLRDDNWACLQVDGDMTISLSDILAKISPSMPGAEIGLFFISTHDKDFVLVKRK